MEILIFDTHRRLSAIIFHYRFMQRHFSEGWLFSSGKELWHRVLEANKKQVSPKIHSLKIRINSVNQILKKKEKVTQTCNINILIKITNRKIPYVYTHDYHVIKNRGPGPYSSLSHADNRKYFSGVSLTRNRREAHMFYLAREVGKIWRCSCWEKGNFIMINKIKYGQTLSLSRYSTFNGFPKCFVIADLFFVKIPKIFWLWFSW